MSILDNAAVLKYFGKVENIAFPGKLYSPGKDPDMDWMVRCVIAERVVRAMEEEINLGDKYIYIEFDHIIELKTSGLNGLYLSKYHPFALKLPDQHQPKRECEHDGLKRYCGKDVYCEECKKNINSFLDNCHLPIPHTGKCQTKPQSEAGMEP